MEVRIKKLCDEAVIPVYQTVESAGADLHSTEETVIEPSRTKLIKTGLAMELPSGFVGLIYARSGLATKRGLAPANKVGVIDSDYRGEIMVALHNHSQETQTVAKGERIAQLVIAPVYQAQFQVVDDISDTQRGKGGFGSTGTK
ncbi:MAG: dUTP diphosphatase [Christensenellaceae bacterium]